MARLQRMSGGGRWALGLGLAFLSGFAVLFGPYIGGSIPIVPAIALLAMFVLALAGGFVLGRWWAVLPLLVATAIGGLAGSWVLTQVSPSGNGSVPPGGEAVFFIFAWFIPLGLVPLIFFLLAGIGIGKLQGMSLGRPHALSRGEATVSRWVAAIGPLLAAGFLAPNVAYIQAQDDVLAFLGSILSALVLAATCLLAGWLFRSWWGFVVAPVVYVAVVALWNQMQGGGATLPVVGFLLYIVLPAVLMSAVGTAIGMYTGGRPQRSRHRGALAT